MVEQYFIVTDIPQFMINSSNGVLTATSSLDYERDARMYIFTVGASMMSSTALAMVTLIYWLF